MEKKRGAFSTKLGFVLAAAGSAVGLGNLWRFPYLAAKYGGGIFILIYLILAVTLGFTLMITFISGNVTAAAGDDYFTEFITKPAQPVVWFAVFVLLTSLIVIIGVEKGIEKASCTFMPILVVLTIGIAIFCIKRKTVWKNRYARLRFSIRQLRFSPD